MQNRILGYDVARALAIFGMIIVNYEMILTGGGVGHWLFKLTGLLQGRAAALFVVLAGVGMSLMVRKARLAGDAPELRRRRFLLLKRALFLLVVGLAYTPLWPGDILHVYGFYITIGVVLLTADPRTLWASSALLVAGFVFLLGFVDYEAGWDWSTLTYEGMWTLTGLTRRIFFNGFNPVLPWAGFLVAGLAIGRLDLGDPRVRRRTLAWSALVGGLVEGASRVTQSVLLPGASALEAEGIVAIFGTTAMPPLPLFMLAAGATAIAAIALSVELAERFRRSIIVRALVAAGQMALSVYVAHFVVGIGLLALLGLVQYQNPYFVVGYAIAFFGLSVLISTLWLRRFERGPLETLMRKITG